MRDRSAAWGTKVKNAKTPNKMVEDPRDFTKAPRTERMTRGSVSSGQNTVKNTEKMLCARMMVKIKPRIGQTHARDVNELPALVATASASACNSATNCCTREVPTVVEGLLAIVDGVCDGVVK